MYWNSLNEQLKKEYGCKVYKLSLSSGCSCPNRRADGTGGCIFCDGADAFAEKGEISLQLEQARRRVSAKIKGEAKYIAYFQSFTNTYAPAQRLEPIFMEAMKPRDVVALSIATRPDCLGNEILELLARCSRVKPVWVELGLQTIHEETAKYIRRGYPLAVFDQAVRDLKQLGITVVVHQILGLPGESLQDMAQTSRYIGNSGADGIKLHLLHVLQNTELAREWRQGRVQLPSLEEYIQWLELCVESLPENIVIHRLTGDGAKKDLLAPLWSGDKKRVLNAIHAAFLKDDVQQGKRFLKV